MAWGNNGDVYYPLQNLTDEGNHTLIVGGMTTLNGGLAVTGAVELGIGQSDTTLQGQLIANDEAHFNELLVAEGAALVTGVFTCEDDVVLQDTLQVDGAATLNSSLAVTGAATLNSSLAVTGAATVNGNLSLGAAQGNAGRLDAQIDGANPRNLEIGSQNTTADIVLGRAGREVRTADDLKVAGDLCVGPNNNPGLINSGGTVQSPQHLKIGNSTVTNDVKLGRLGQTVDFSGQARLNSNGVVMNDAAAVDTALSGCGFIFNAAGHNGGGPAIDVYTEGVLRGWMDSTGFVNA